MVCEHTVTQTIRVLNGQDNTVSNIISLGKKGCFFYGKLHRKRNYKQFGGSQTVNHLVLEHRQLVVLNVRPGSIISVQQLYSL